MKITSRRNFIKNSGTLFASACTMPFINLKTKNVGPNNSKLPNILYIFTDQQNFYDIGAHGNPHVQTPVMDSLIKGGLSFKKSYCVSPVCGPDRSAMLTSRMPHETGVNYNGQTPRESIPNMGEIFKEKGYRTIWGGKWHLPESYPLRSGSKQKEIRGFELLPFYDSKLRHEWGRGLNTDQPLANAVSNFLMNYKDNKPFLLGASFHNPHDICYHPREPQQFPMPINKEKLPPLPPNFNINSTEPEFYKIRRQQKKYGEALLMTQNYTPLQWQSYLYYYYKLTEKVDQAIGIVLEALRKSGREKDTLVIFTSDHGDGASSHKWATKLSLYEESVNVPFIIYWKGKIKPQKMDWHHVVSGLDILPTMLDFAGFKIPSEMLGQSLRPIVENKAKNFRDYVVTELALNPKKPSLKGRMIRTSQYKYNLFSEGLQNEQLFDLYRDPGETQNLSNEPTLQNFKNRLRGYLYDWMEITNDDFKYS